MKTLKLESHQLRNIIQEEKELYERNVRFEKMLLRELTRLESENQSREAINEAAFDFMDDIGKGFKSMGSGFIQSMKFKLAQELLEYLSISKGSILSKVIANVFESVTIERVKEYMGPSGGETITEDLIKALVEGGLVEPAVDDAVESLGIDKDNPIYISMREGIVDTIIKEIKGPVKEMIVEFFKDFDFKGMLGKVTKATGGATNMISQFAKSFL